MTTTHIFLHNFRCTGNNLNTAILGYFKNQSIKLGQVDNRFFKYPDIVKQAKRKQPRFILGHNAFGLHERFDFECRYFFNVRDPIKRLISGFSGWSKKKGDNLLDYYEGHEEQFNGMTYRLLGYGKQKDRWFHYPSETEMEAPPPIDDQVFEQALDHYRNWVDAVLVTEKFNESVCLLEKTLHLPKLIVPQTMNFNQSKSFLKPEHFPPDLLSELRERNHYDYMLYDTVKADLNQKLQEQDDAFHEQVRIRKILSDALKISHVDMLEKRNMDTALDQLINQLCYFGMYYELTEAFKLFVQASTVPQAYANWVVEFLQRVLPKDMHLELKKALQERFRRVG